MTFVMMKQEIAANIETDEVPAVIRFMAESQYFSLFTNGLNFKNMCFT